MLLLLEGQKHSVASRCLPKLDSLPSVEKWIQDVEARQEASMIQTLLEADESGRISLTNSLL